MKERLRKMRDAVYVVKENGHVCEDILEAWDWQDAGYTIVWYLKNKPMGEMK